MLSRRSLFPAFIAMLGLFSLAMPAIAGDGTKASLHKVRVQLKWLHQFQFAGFYAAIQQGYYREAGLDVELREAGLNETSVEAVVRGEAEFGVHGSDLVVERALGKPVVALATILQHSPMVLLSRRDHGIDTLHDLARKRVLLGPDAAELLAYLRAESVANKSLRLGSQSFDLEALIQGDVDAMPGYSTDEPWLLEQRKIPYNAFSPRAAGIDFYGDTLFTTEALLEKRPEAVRRFVEATQRGWYYALAHRTEIIDLILAQYTQRHSREHLEFEAEQIRRLMTPELVEIGHMNPGRWRHVADTYAELGMMPVNFDLGGFLYNPHPKPDYRAFYLWGGGISLLAVWGLLWSVYYRRQSRRLGREIADRQAAEAQLRESEQRYRGLLEAAPFPILISRVEDGRILYANDRAGQEYGDAQQALIGHDATEFYEDPAEREVLLAALELGGDVRDLELRILDRRGRAHVVLVSAILTRFEGQAAVFASLSDISTRIELERELKEREQRLRLFSDMPFIGMSLVEPQGYRWVWFNKHLCDILGYGEAELRALSWVDLTHPDDLDLDRDLLTALLAGESEGYGIEKRYIRKDGSIVHVLLDVRCVWEANGQPRYIVATTQDISERKRLETELYFLANTDTLTGVDNRRHFLELLKQEIVRCRRYGHPLALLGIDIDHFKAVNDTYGHAGGDDALRGFTRLLPVALRNTDFAGRLGGEEFAIALPETSLDEARGVAERLRARVESQEIASGEHTIRITVSIGLAQLTPDGSLEDLLQAADHALYAAKHAGRNRVEVCGQHPG